MLLEYSESVLLAKTSNAATLIGNICNKISTRKSTKLAVHIARLHPLNLKFKIELVGPNRVPRLAPLQLFLDKVAHLHSLRDVRMQIDEIVQQAVRKHAGKDEADEIHLPA